METTSGGVRKVADDIRQSAQTKVSVTMKCAAAFSESEGRRASGSAAQRCLSAWIGEGQSPAAYFLEDVNEKWIDARRIFTWRQIMPTGLHAGAGTAAGLAALIEELKSRVERGIWIALEEEDVQYVGFQDGDPRLNRIRQTSCVLAALAELLAQKSFAKPSRLRCVCVSGVLNAGIESNFAIRWAPRAHGPPGRKWLSADAE